MDYFNELGARIAHRWKEAGQSDASLIAIAHEELERTPAHRSVRTDDILEWVNQPGFELPRQGDIEARFGEPPVTMFSTDSFRIDVNFWLDATTVIHGHRFDGAFQVLSGSSLHTSYGYTEQARHDESLGMGELRLLVSEVLSPGDTRPIEAGLGFQHALFHLERPSSTVVVRTHRSQQTAAQHEFAPLACASTPTSRSPPSSGTSRSPSTCSTCGTPASTPG